MNTLESRFFPECTFELQNALFHPSDSMAENNPSLLALLGQTLKKQGTKGFRFPKQMQLPTSER